LNDIRIAVVEGLHGFPDAIEAVYPKTQIQPCIVHLIQNSLAFARWKELNIEPLRLSLLTRQPIATRLKPL
jgi:transposase-like protein